MTTGSTLIIELTGPTTRTISTVTPPIREPLAEDARLAATRDAATLLGETQPSVDAVLRAAIAACDASGAGICLLESDGPRLVATVGDTTRAAEMVALGWSVIRGHPHEQHRQGGAIEVPTGRPRTASTVQDVAAAPLVTDEGHTVGVLCVAAETGRDLAAIHPLPLPHLAGVVVHTLRSLREVRTRRRLKVSLADLATKTELDDVGPFADALVASSRRVPGADGGCLILTAGVRQHEAAWDAGSTLYRDIVDLDGQASAAATSLRSQTTVFTADPSDHDLIEPHRALALGVRAILHVPLTDAAGSAGLMVAWWVDPVPRLDAAEVLATTASVALSRIRALAELKAAADTDPLTGLANRRAGQTVLDRLSPGGAVLLLDLDRFKEINDDLGHEAGDEALTSFATHLADAVADDGWAVRWGGEEFLLILPGGAPAARAVLDRIRRRWRAPLAPTTFSTGVAIRAASERADRTLARADAALYAAKRTGRDRDLFSAPTPES